MLITSSASTADLFDAFEGDYLIARTNEGASSDVEAWLRRCRGWPDKWLFNLFPTDVHWWWAVPQPADLVYLIGMKYEFGLPTDGTFRAEDFRACDDGFVADHRAVFLGRDELDEHERKRLADEYLSRIERVRTYAEALQRGEQFPPCVLVAQGTPADDQAAGPFVVLEGNTRAIAHAALELPLPPVLLGTSEGMAGWHFGFKLAT